MKTANKCYQATTEQARAGQRWFVVDATDQVLGRLAVKIATVLMGKNKPTYTPHVDTGDFVIVLNAGKVRINGNRKREQVVYQHYTGYPSGLRETTMARMLDTHPDRVLHEAVRRMMPKNALAAKMIKKLKIYPGDTHEHQAQQPEPLAL